MFRRHLVVILALVARILDSRRAAAHQAKDGRDKHGHDGPRRGCSPPPRRHPRARREDPRKAGEGRPAHQAEDGRDKHGHDGGKPRARTKALQVLVQPGLTLREVGAPDVRAAAVRSIEVEKRARSARCPSG